MKKQEARSKPSNKAGSTSGSKKLVAKSTAKATSTKKAQKEPTTAAKKTKTQEKKLNELVERLTKKHEVECARPEKTAEALKECIDRDYVHVIFKKTGTELGIQLDRRYCNFEEADFENAKGKVNLVGGLTLNYDKVKCIAEIDLTTCKGKGYLEPLSDEDYQEMMSQSDK